MDYVVQCKTMGISNYEYLYIHSCFDKGCPTKVKKRTRQCRLALWVVRVWLCLMVEVHGDSATRKEKARIHMLKQLELTQATVKTTITHNNFRHCRVSFSPFARQPFSKQLYKHYHDGIDFCWSNWEN